MKVLKQTILIATLFLFSSPLAKCQWAGYEGEVTTVMPTEEAIIVTEEAVVVTEEAIIEISEEMVVAPPEEIIIITEETIIPTEEAVIPSEETIIVACPQYIEVTEVDGYWMTLHPCCVSANAQCDNSYEPVCIEQVKCEDEHCRWRYETVENVCQACKGHSNWQYSLGQCPWDLGEY